MTANQMKCGNATADGKSATHWWLRSPRMYNSWGKDYAGRVICASGLVDSNGNAVNAAIGVRPAVTIKLK